MNISIKLTDRGTQINLKRFADDIPKAFKNVFKEEMDNMAKYARDFLGEASRRHTGQKYWTGTLQSAIKSSILEDDKNRIEGIVGVDATVERQTRFGRRIVVDYDVIVEKIGRGPWGGYHYMENAYMALAPGMAGRIANKLKGELERIVKTPWGFRGEKGR